jgi:hypothetical protein
VGDKVTITLPNNETTPGAISSVGTVATAGQNGGSSTMTVLVIPTDPTATGDWDQAPLEVTISTDSVKNALVVPVDALLAQSSGGYAVEVVAGRRHPPTRLDHLGSLRRRLWPGPGDRHQTGRRPAHRGTGAMTVDTTTVATRGPEDHRLLSANDGRPVLELDPGRPSWASSTTFTIWG